MSKKLTQQFGCSKMMLPEHRRELQKQEEIKQQEESKKPSLWDDQQLELWDRMICLSLRQKVLLKITYRSEEHHHTAEGIVIGKREGTVKIFLPCRERLLEIPIKKIAGMELAEPGEFPGV